MGMKAFREEYEKKINQLKLDTPAMIKELEQK